MVVVKTQIHGAPVTGKPLFISEEDSFRILRSFRWQKGIGCPRCESTNISRSVAHPLQTHAPIQRYLCLKCHYHFNDIASTVFEKSQTPLWKWFVIIHLVMNTRKIAVRRIADLLEISEKTALEIVHRVRSDALANQVGKYLEGLKTRGAIRVKVSGKEVTIKTFPEKLKLPQETSLSADAAYSRQSLRIFAEQMQDVSPLYDQISAFALGTASHNGKIAKRPAQNGTGTFTFVLNSHVPYVRLAGRWPRGENWLHDALAETYIPLLNVLYTLRSKQVPYRITLSLSPVFLAQLCDPHMQNNTSAYIAERIKAAEQNTSLFRGRDEKIEEMSHSYAQRYRDILSSYERIYQRNIVGAFKQLQDEGYIEIMAGAGTYPYLPLLNSESSINAQVKVGMDTYVKCFGREPRAFWFPECAFKPEEQSLPKALERFGIKSFVVDNRALKNAKFFDDFTSEAAPIKTPPVGSPMSVEEWLTCSSYRLNGYQMAAIVKNQRLSDMILSATRGYSRDAWYRDSTKVDDMGLAYWRVTGYMVDSLQKAVYDPRSASARVQAHSAHFGSLVEEVSKAYHSGSGSKALLVSACDAELFGRNWFEGIDWLAQVLEKLASSKTVRLATVSEAKEANPPRTAAVLRESSWGTRGDHSTWSNFETAWMWPMIRESEAHMEHLAKELAFVEGDVNLVLKQAARELLLMQSSDWPYLITTGKARDYAIERFKVHLRRFQILAGALDAGHISAVMLKQSKEWQHLDNVFADVDPSFFINEEKSSEQVKLRAS